MMAVVSELSIQQVSSWSSHLSLSFILFSHTYTGKGDAIAPRDTGKGGEIGTSLC